MMTTGKPAKMKRNQRKKKPWVFFKMNTASTESEKKSQSGGDASSGISQKQIMRVKAKKLKRKQRVHKNLKLQNGDILSGDAAKTAQGSTVPGEANLEYPTGRNPSDVQQSNAGTVSSHTGESKSTDRCVPRIDESDALRAKKFKRREKRKRRIQKRKELDRRRKLEGGETSGSAKPSDANKDNEGLPGRTRSAAIPVRQTKCEVRGSPSGATPSSSVTTASLQRAARNGTTLDERSDNPPDAAPAPKRKGEGAGDGRWGKRKRSKGEDGKRTRDDTEKRRRTDDNRIDSETSSGTETPHLPEKPQDVAANWKALSKKLNISTQAKHGTQKRKEAPNDLKIEKEDAEEDEIWFDDVDPALLETKSVPSLGTPDGRGGGGSDGTTNRITKCVGLDCEMVGTGLQGKDSILARVSMVNRYGECIYDKFVKPREKVTDYRTAVSGVRPSNLVEGEEFLTVQKEVAAIMKGRVLVGHALRNDMKVLFLGHPRRFIRDTAKYQPFRELMKTKRPSLKKLAKSILGVTVQEGEHNSVEDARTAMRIYTLHRMGWEKSLKQRQRRVQKDA